MPNLSSHAPRGHHRPPAWRLPLAVVLTLLSLPCRAPSAEHAPKPRATPPALQAATSGTSLASAAAFPDHAVLQLRHVYPPRPLTLSTSEGAPYGDTDFWPRVDTTTTAFGYGPTMVQRVYICLSGMVKMEDCSAQPTPTGPLPDEMLAGIDQRLGQFAGTGKRLLVRFVYNLGPIGRSARDVPAALITTHIEQLAPLLHKQQDLVFALEAGFIGTWGEWHSSTAGNTAPAARHQVFQHLLRHFRGRFPILMRYPGQLIEAMGSTRTDPDLGLHDDFYASDTTDGGTWASYNNPSVTSRDLLQQFAADVAVRAMFVGEFGQLDPARQSCDALDRYSRRFHPQSFALGVWPVEVGKALVASGCAQQFFHRIGTRIELQAARLAIGPTPADQPGTVHAELTLQNTGYGRVIRARPAFLVLTQARKEVARLPISLAQLDLRWLGADAEPQTFAFRLRLPVGLVALGQRRPIDAHLLIPDPAPTLTTQAAYALPLNSLDDDGKDLFDPRTGWNRLGRLDPP